MRRRVLLRIHREDHKNDALGLVFLGALDPPRCVELLQRYLGPQARVRHAELEDAVLEVEAEVREFSEESQNLVRLAREMLKTGRIKGAVGQLEEALRLSPLNGQALKSLGRLYYRHRQRELARYYLTRAREVAPEDGDVLRLLAEIALHEERPLQAREYLEQLLERDPRDRRARAALARLLPAEARRIQEAVASARKGESSRSEPTGGGEAPDEEGPS